MAIGTPAHLGVLGRAEQLLWDGYPHGALTDVRTLPEAERTVRGEVVAALLLGAVEAEPGRVPALRLRGARIEGDIDVRGGEVGAELALSHCELTGVPIIADAATRTVRFLHCRLPGLHADLARVDGTLRIDHSTVTGPVRVKRALITGSFHMDATTVSRGAEEWAVSAGGFAVESGMFVRDGFVAEGGFRMPGARVEGGISMNRATLRNPGGVALIADNLTAHTFDCEDLVTEGEVRLIDVRVSGRLGFAGARLSAPGGIALHLARAQVGLLVFKPGAPVIGKVNLTYGQYGIISDDPDMWPEALNLNGTVYAAVQAGSRPLDVAARLDWISRETDGYRPQPYEQLAAYYRSVGHDELARHVLLVKERRHRRTLPPVRRTMSRLLDWTVGYGYRPARALLWMVGLAVVGAVVFSLDRPSPTGPSSGSFNVVVYTLDMLLPVSVFDERSSWSASGAAAWVGYALRAAGWLLTTAVIAGLTRVLNRR
ncbi:oxidoreductase [Streptomycetaceae bacterium NBC_01309]